MSRSLILGIVGLAVVVLLFVFVRRDEPRRDGGELARPDSPSTSAPNLAVEEQGPKSLRLGGAAPAGGVRSGGPAAESGDGSSSRAELERYRQAHRPARGGGGPRHPRRDDGADESAPGTSVKSQLDEPERLGGNAASGSGRRVAANRAVIDDWAGVETGGDPANIREPEEGEVLTLFEGDPIAAQNEATVAKDVAFEENSAEFTPDSEYAVPMAGKLTGDTGTISFWVRPNGETSSSDNASLVQLRSQYEWANRLQIWKDGSNVRMVFADGAGVETGATYGSDAWADDEWRLVTVTWGDRLNAMYVNGQLAGTSQYEGGFKILPGTVLHVGSNYPDTPSSLNGSVSQFRVYNRALTPDEVAELPSQYPE
jgi:hypothetical protein